MKQIEHHPREQNDETSIVARGQEVARHLGGSARNFKFQNLNRRQLYQAVGIRPRPRDQIFSLLIRFSIIPFFLLPVIAAIIYFGFIASATYESEVRFVVRSAVPALDEGRASSNKGSPAAKIAQDTQVIANYIDSAAMFKELSQVLPMARIYSDSSIDRFSRLDPSATIEERSEYWQKRIEQSIDGSSGIMTLNVEAFSGKDARDILNAVVKIAEGRVNLLNESIWVELIGAAERDVENAGETLKDVRIAYEKQQNESGVFNVLQAAESINEIIAEVRVELLELESRRNVLVSNTSKNSRVVRALDKEIESRRQQIDQMQAQITGAGKDRKNLARFSTEFERLETERSLAQDRFADAVRELERVKLIGSLQLVYLDTFLPPNLPEDTNGLGRLVQILLSVIGALVLWGLVVFGLFTVRSKFD